MTQSINELKSYTEYNVSTPTSVFTIGFEYEYNVDGINVYVDGVEATAAGYTVQHDSQGTVTLTPAVPSGVVRLSRETNIDTSAHTFSAGAKFIAGNMDENFKQVRHAQQEVRDVVLRTASEFSILDANATAALQTATTAVNTANSIDAKATTALSNSSTALSVANGVDAKATSALSSANTADSNATTALNTANTAQSVANGIDAKATQAQSDASTALSTVTTQKGAANGIAPLDEDAKIDPIYLPNATETTSGVAKIATTAIAQEGVNDTDFITPLKLKSSVFGLGQTWQDVKESRALATTYTNTTGRPIMLYISVIGGAGSASWGTLTIGGQDVGWVGGYSSSYYSATAVVPVGATYSLTSVGGGGIRINKWTELR